MANIESETQNVLSALSTIYTTDTTTTTSSSSSSSVTTTREQANQYLTQYQRSPIAWEISNQLLSSPSTPIIPTSSNIHHHHHHVVQTSSSATIKLQQQIQIYFFAAQTLHTKCRADMLQLPSTSWNSLRESIMNHLVRFCDEVSKSNNSIGSSSITGSSTASYYRPVISRLAMALCALSVQMEWYDVVDQLILNSSSSSSSSSAAAASSNHTEHHNISNNIINGYMDVVLEMAQLLPEEATNYRLLMQDKGKREGFIQSLVDKSKNVFEFFYMIVCHVNQMSSSSSGGGGSYYNSGPDGGAGAAVGVGVGGTSGSSGITIGSRKSIKIKEQILKCIHAWVRYIHLPPQLLHETPLIDWVFSILKSYDINSDVDDGEMFELAVDVIIEILRCYPSDHGENIPLMHKMIPAVISLAQQQQQQQQQPGGSLTPFQKALQNEDEDGMRAYCRIFTEMGESYMSFIMDGQDHNQVYLVDLVLSCTALPDHEIATITLHFWYRFVSWLEDLFPYEFRQYKIDYFTDQIIKLVSNCTTLLQYPKDIDTLLPDKIDDISRVRFNVCDTIGDSCRLLGSHSVLQKIGESLNLEIQRLSGIPQNQQLLHWHGIESCLLALDSISRYIPSDESHILPDVMKMIPELPSSVIYLRRTANRVVGGYASWLIAHPDYLQPILPFLAQGLQEPKCASSAAVAIRFLCQNCTSAYSLGDSMLQLYDSILQAQQQQNNSVLDIKDELEVLEGTCIAVSRQMDDIVRKAAAAHQQQDMNQFEEMKSNYISRIVNPIGSKLVEYTNANSTAGPKQVIAEIERLTVVIRCLRVPDPSANSTYSIATNSDFIVSMMTQCWDCLDYLSQKFTSDINFAEKLCRLHKYCIRGCKAEHYQPLLEKLRTQLVNNFSRSHQSPYLYAASICIGEYSTTGPKHEQFLFDMFQQMSNDSFLLLRSFENFTDHPDVVEELLFLAVKMIEKSPRIFVCTPGLFLGFLQCAIVGLKQDHRDVNRGTLNFLECTFQHGVNLQKGVGAGVGAGSGTGSATTVDVVHIQTSKACLEQAVAAEGQNIVDCIIRSLLRELPCYRVACNQGSVAGILYQLNLLCPAQLLEWVKAPLALASEGSRCILVDTLKHHGGNKSLFFEGVEHFASVCDENQKMGRNTI